jgi:2-hydroxychromene-2-carboxylate isomerase/GNAT superfamily N-acetyltransferase
MTPRIEVHFDYLSPYAFFGWLDARALCARRGWELVPRPVLFPALLDHWGQLGPAEIAPKRAYVMRACLRAAALRDVPFIGPATHPFRPLTALRLSLSQVAAEAQFAVVDALFSGAWSHGVDMGDDDAIGACLGAAGLDAESLLARARGPRIKAQLRADTEDAIARGVFGVPTFLVGDELFWGADSLGDLERFVDGDDVVTAGAKARLARMVSGATRPRRTAPAGATVGRQASQAAPFSRPLGGDRSLRSYADPERYLAEVGPLFAAAGVGCDMIESIARRLMGPDPVYTEWTLGAVFQGEEAIVATLQTPPHAMHITAATDDEIWPLVEAYSRVSGVFGPDGTVRRFVELGGRPHTVDGRMRLFEARQVRVPRPCEGAMRHLVPEDFELVSGWFDAFQEDIQEDVPRPGAQKVASYVGRLFVWLGAGGDPVSMAGWGGRTATTARVNAVYTPREHRGRGYASNLVAGVSQHLLDDGCSYLTLFTDLSNPTSNSIYAKIGYRPVADLTKIRFDD